MLPVEAAEAAAEVPLIGGEEDVNIICTNVAAANFLAYLAELKRTNVPLKIFDGKGVYELEFFFDLFPDMRDPFVYSLASYSASVPTAPWRSEPSLANSLPCLPSPIAFLMRYVKTFRVFYILKFGDSNNTAARKAFFVDVISQTLETNIYEEEFGNTFPLMHQVFPLIPRADLLHLDLSRLELEIVQKVKNI